MNAPFNEPLASCSAASLANGCACGVKRWGNEKLLL